jgi:hypothetical protein
MLEASAIDLRITGVVRAGSNVILPVVDGDELYVGDRLIGCYVIIGRGDRAVRLRVEVNPDAHPGSSSRGSIDDDDRPSDGSWELHTTNMRAGGYTLTLQLLEPTSDGNTRCCDWVALDFRLALRPVAAPSPRPPLRELAWKLTSEHDPAACQ